METTIAISRMILSGVFDRFPTLSVLVAHTGGTLPFLAGRLKHCITHDRHVMSNPEAKNSRSIADIIQNNLLLDTLSYGKAGIDGGIEVAGAGRLMFGK